MDVGLVDRDGKFLLGFAPDGLFQQVIRYIGYPQDAVDRSLSR